MKKKEEIITVENSEIVVSEQEVIRYESQIKKKKHNNIYIIFAVVCSLLSMSAFNDKQIIAGLLSGVEAVLFVVVWLVNRNSIKLKYPKMKKIVLILAFVLIIPAANMYNPNAVEIEKIEWSQIVLSDVLPNSKMKKGVINENSLSMLDVDLYDVTKNDYYSYVDECIDNGFDIDVDREEDTYSAYNKDGYFIEILFIDYDKEYISIKLNEPLTFTEIYWPQTNETKLLPTPKSLVGKIEWESSDGFLIYIYDYDKADFNEYINLCMEKGFTKEYHKSDEEFSAENEYGCRLSVDYLGFNTIKINYDISEILFEESLYENENIESSKISEENTTTTKEATTKEATTKETTTKETTTKEATTKEATTKEATTKEATTKEATTKETTTKEITTEYVPLIENKEKIVYITETGTKYHNYGCRHLKSIIEISLQDAEASGYTPCGVCH